VSHSFFNAGSSKGFGMAVTRRQFLFRVGQVGGYSAAFTMMQALGLLPIAATKAQAIRGVSANGTRVIILGGGIAGLLTPVGCGLNPIWVATSCHFRIGSIFLGVAGVTQLVAVPALEA